MTSGFNTTSRKSIEMSCHMKKRLPEKLIKGKIHEKREGLNTKRQIKKQWVEERKQRAEIACKCSHVEIYIVNGVIYRKWEINTEKVEIKSHGSKRELILFSAQRRLIKSGSRLVEDLSDH